MIFCSLHQMLNTTHVNCPVIVYIHIHMSMYVKANERLESNLQWCPAVLVPFINVYVALQYRLSFLQISSRSRSAQPIYSRGFGHYILTKCRRGRMSLSFKRCPLVYMENS